MTEKEFARWLLVNMRKSNGLRLKQSMKQKEEKEDLDIQEINKK